MTELTRYMVPGGHGIEAHQAGLLYSKEQVDAVITEQASEIMRLRAALVECRDEIDDYVRHEYPHDHPVQERCRQRDFSANPARIALEAKP